MTVLGLGAVCEVPAQPGARPTPVACLAKVREEVVASGVVSAGPPSQAVEVAIVYFAHTEGFRGGPSNLRCYSDLRIQ